MSYVIATPELSSVAVAGGIRRFPVRRIYCVGRNYAEHAREMGGDPDREPPFFFAKPADAVVPSGSKIPFPPGTQNLHHEIELVVALGGEGADVAPDNALDLVYGYAVGIDLTRRDLQGALREKGRPWELGKGFDKSAPIGLLYPASAIGHPSKGRIWLNVNDEPRQDGDIADLVWSVPELLSTLSRYFTLRPGDLIFTGTPAGVGPIQPGDKLNGGVDGLGEIEVYIG
jgi:fumarylpyruvate hydrolase